MPRIPTSSSSSAPSISTINFVSNALDLVLRWGITNSTTNSVTTWGGYFYWYTLTTGSANNNVFGSGAASGQVLTASTAPWNWQRVQVPPDNTSP